MGERKVLNKYFPPDFNPRIISRRSNPKDGQIVVRMMLPMRIICNTCGAFIGEGTKLNSRKELVVNQTYLGIPIFRFYLRCKSCSVEIAFKTDPKNSDYLVEFGATRTSEQFGDEKEEKKRKRDAEEEEAGDSMKQLEKKTKHSKREIDSDIALGELKSLKSRHASVTVDHMIQLLHRRSAKQKADARRREDDEDEALIKSIVFRRSNDFVRRIHLDDDDDDV